MRVCMELRCKYPPRAYRETEGHEEEKQASEMRMKTLSFKTD